MKLLTVRSEIKDEISRFLYAVRDQPRWTDKAEKIKAVDPDHVTQQDLASITGTDNWGRIHCTECKAIVAVAVEFDDEKDCDFTPSRLCMACLQKAIGLCFAAEMARGKDANPLTQFPPSS